MSKPARGAGNMVRDEREEGEERTLGTVRTRAGDFAAVPGSVRRSARTTLLRRVWSADAAMVTVTGCTLQLPVSTEPASQKVVEAHLRRARGVRFRRLTLRTGG